MRCLGCRSTFRNKIGLSNHRRVCVKWKTYDGVAKFKKRRLEMQSIDPPSSQLPAETSDLAQLNNPGAIEDDLVESPRAQSLPAVSPLTSTTRSGRSMRFPRRFDDFLPGMRTALAHIPSKENPRAIVASMSQPGLDSLVVLPQLKLLFLRIWQ